MFIHRIYNLAAIDGALLPAATIAAGVTVFFLNGTWASSVTMEEGPQPLPDVGTYTLDEDTGAAALEMNAQPFAAGVLTADLAILTGGGLTFTSARAP